MSIFDEQAQLAARQVFRDDPDATWAKIFEAAEASLRERGMLREGFVLAGSDFITYEKPEDGEPELEPVAIIRISPIR